MNKYNIEHYYCNDCLIDNVLDALLTIKDFKESDYSTIAILCKENLAEKLLKMFSNIEIEGFEFNYGILDFDTYDYEYDEYAVTITSDGELSIQKAWYEDEEECKYFEEDLVFFSNECSSKLLLKQIENDNEVIAFSLDAE